MFELTDTPSFELDDPTSTLPFRDRRDLGEGWVTFASSNEEFSVLIDQDSFQSLQSLARDALPNEAFGLLLGRSFHDSLGEYTVIAASVEPTDLHATPGSVHVDPTQAFAVKQLATRSFPLLNIVGWWHSHHWPSQFSSTDRQEQTKWTKAHHVGLLLFASGTPAAVAYHGPHATELPLVPAPTVAVTCASEPPALAPTVIVDENPAVETDETETPHRRWRERLLTAACIAAVVATVGAMAADRLANPPRPAVTSEDVTPTVTTRTPPTTSAPVPTPPSATVAPETQPIPSWTTPPTTTAAPTTPPPWPNWPPPAPTTAAPTTPPPWPPLPPTTPAPTTTVNHVRGPR